MVTVVDNGNRTDRAKATSLGIKPKKVPPKPGPLMAAITVNGVGVSEEAIRLEAQHHPADNPGAALTEAARALVIRELLLQERRGCGSIRRRGNSMTANWRRGRKH